MWEKEIFIKCLHGLDIEIGTRFTKSLYVNSDINN